ncbi:MAG: thiol-disulfide oxidoreductase DCC family protein [Polyangiaceae bacterium]
MGEAESVTDEAAEAQEATAMTGPLVLFDGVCNLCNGSVNFMIDRDPGARLRFAALQSKGARAALEGALGKDAADRALPSEGDDPGSVLLFQEGKLYDRSSAALRIARHLTWPWRVLFVLLVVPRPLRDLVYRFIAENRYRWFGKSEVCRVPTPELRARFLT